MQPPPRPQSAAEQSQFLPSTPSEQDGIARSIDDLPRTTIRTNEGRKEGIRAGLLNWSQSRRSWIWDYGYDLVDVESKHGYWLCNICNVKHSARGVYKYSSTSGPDRHLEKFHGIRKLKKRKPNNDEHESDDVLMDETSNPASSRTSSSTAQSTLPQMFARPIRQGVSFVTKDLATLFKQKLILWIVSYQKALSEVENREFRALKCCSLQDPYRSSAKKWQHYTKMDNAIGT